MKRLQERIQFLTPAPVSDGAGGTTAGYIDGYLCWADVIFGGSNRGEVNGQTINTNTVTVVMRANTDFYPVQGNTFTWRGKILTIHGPVNPAEKKYITFQAAYDAAKTY